MTARLTRRDYDRIAVAIVGGSNLNDAARLVGVTGRTIERRMNADENVARLIREAMALRDAMKERAPHGTTTRYDAGGCRCQPCRDAHASSVRLRRHRRKNQPLPTDIQHGRYSTYRDWSCRCTECRHAWNEHSKPYSRAWYERNKQRKAAS